jgi:hypothetical protein
VLPSPSPTDPPADFGVFLEPGFGRSGLGEDVGEAAAGHDAADVGGVARPLEEVGVDVERDRVGAEYCVSPADQPFRSE